MLISKCKKCGYSFWESYQGAREEDLCDYCEDLPVSHPDQPAPELMGTLCWKPAHWDADPTPRPLPRPSHFIAAIDDGFVLQPIEGPSDVIPQEQIVVGQCVQFVAYRLRGTHMLDVYDDDHDVYPDLTPTANTFTISPKPYDLTNGFNSVRDLVERGHRQQRLPTASYDMSASWWSSVMFTFCFNVDRYGRGFFEPVLNSEYIVAYCDSRGKIETISARELIPPGAIMLAEGATSTILAAIDAHTQRKDDAQFIPEMSSLGNQDARILCLERWHKRVFPSHEWQPVNKQQAG